MRRIRAAFAAILLMLPLSAAFSQSEATVAPHGEDPTVWLGSLLPKVLETLGPPEAVRSVRGPESWQDDVVFQYKGLELYWFKDRVWQVRAESAYGFRVGDASEVVFASLGEPLHRLDSGFVYQSVGRSWPTRIRVSFAADGRVSDIYVYRADF